MIIMSKTLFDLCLEKKYLKKKLPKFPLCKYTIAYLSIQFETFSALDFFVKAIWGGGVFFFISNTN